MIECLDSKITRFGMDDNGHLDLSREVIYTLSNYCVAMTTKHSDHYLIEGEVENEGYESRKT